MRSMVIAMGAAAALAVPAGAAAADAPFMGGLTSQHEPVVMKLAVDARSVRRANIALDLRCSDGGGTTFTDHFEDVPVSPHGRFAGVYDTGTIDLGGGSTGRIRSSVRGRVRRGGAEVRGTWSLTYTEDDGQSVATCRSGAVRFDLRR